MNRILFEKSEVVDGFASFSGERAEHVLNVLHGEVGGVLKTGELDGCVGTSVITEIRELHEREAGSPQRGSGLLAGTIVVKCSHEIAPKPPWFDIVLAPPRPRVLKRLLPQLVALGAGKIVLVGADRVEKSFWGAQVLKEPVYRPLLVDGLMQSGTSTVPVIRCERSFARYAESAIGSEFAGCEKIVAHPGAVNNARSSAGRDAGDGRRTVIAVGPEGGWTDREVSILEGRGFRRHSLGSRILRTDTATIAVIAQLMAERDIYGNG